MSHRLPVVLVIRCCSSRAGWEPLRHPEDTSDRALIFFDLAIIAAFVLIGRNEHNSGSQIIGYLTTVSPFLIATLVAWSLPHVRQSPGSVPAGLTVWATVIILGMVLRRTIFGGGTAVPFVVVATVFNGAFFQAWRVVARARSRRPDRGLPEG